MLDQNTDRMWYVIGAVIIGAALIFIMNGTMPDLFASVGKTFEDKVEDVKGVVSEIKPNDPAASPGGGELTDGIKPPTKPGAIDIGDLSIKDYVFGLVGATSGTQAFYLEGDIYYDESFVGEQFKIHYPMHRMEDIYGDPYVVIQPDAAGQATYGSMHAVAQIIAEYKTGTTNYVQIVIVNEEAGLPVAKEFFKDWTFVENTIDIDGQPHWMLTAYTEKIR